MLDNSKNENPLKSPNGYYPFGTLDTMPLLLQTLDKHKIDFESLLHEKVILDIGCGDGDLSFFFETFQPKRIIAIDYGPTNYNSMEACYTLKHALKSEVEFLNVDIHSYDFEELPQVDITFSFGFLYHSRHPFWILENLYKVTDRLFLKTKVFDDDNSYMYFYDVGECNNDPTNWYCFSPKCISLMLKRAGFQTMFSERLDSNVGRSHPVDIDLDGRMLFFAEKHSP
jgi:SAM-dependent methyltransferase